MEAGATNKYTCFVIGHFNVLREVEQVISVVIPVYNAEKYLHECIESVLKQDYDNYEIVLVDDGSTDKSAKICDDYAARYERITVVHKKHAGLAKVRLTGVEVAKGQYIVSLDSDDVLFDGLLSHINKIIKKWEPEIICYDLQEFGIDDAKKRENTYAEGLYFGSSLENIIKTYLYNESAPFFTAGIIYGIVTKAVKREMLLNALNDVPGEISLGEDLATTALLLREIKKIYITHFIGYGYRQIMSSISHKYSDKTIDELKRLVLLLSESYLCSTIGEIPDRQISAFVSFRLIKYISDISNAEKLSESIRQLKKIDKEVIDYVKKAKVITASKVARLKIALLKSYFRVILLLIFRLKYKRR